MSKLSVLIVGLAMAAAACSADGSAEPATEPSSSATSPAETITAPAADTIVIRASSDLAVGTERLLVALSSSGGDRLGSPTQRVAIDLFPQDAPSDVQSVDGVWIWAIPDVSGLYRAEVEFDRPGTWVAQVSLDGTPLEPIGMTVSADPFTPAIGEPAPASETPTAADGADLAAISTDLDPDPALYEISIADAVASGSPTVIAFATPKFCQTAICGPTLEGIKEMRPQFPDVNFIHVEVFDLEASGDAQTLEELVVHESVLEWGLPSEPWIFVVDGDGIVTGRFEGVVSREEIEAALV